MDRRTFLKALPIGLTAAGGLAVGEAIRRLDPDPWPFRRHPDLGPTDLDPVVPLPIRGAQAEAGLPPRGAHVDPLVDEGSRRREASRARSMRKSLDFEQDYPDDRWLAVDRLPLLRRVHEHLARAQRVIGHGHFNLVGFDHLVSYGRQYPTIGSFDRAELDFIGQLFATDATEYGFFGDKVLTRLTSVIHPRDVTKVPGSGHYLLRGDPLEQYHRVRRDLGESILLTSGIRSIVKQLHLFVAKAVNSKGNLSRAARSLAPPGYSYHAVGDFDLGKAGLGERNFTDSFALTDEYHRLIELGYIQIRYEETNPYGVRHEPWHIKIGHRG